MKATCQNNPDWREPHGKQDVLQRLLRYGYPPNEQVQLACGCDFPISWLPTHEREPVLREFPTPTRYVGQQRGDEYKDS